MSRKWIGAAPSLVGWKEVMTDSETYNLPLDMSCMVSWPWMTYPGEGLTRLRKAPSQTEASPATEEDPSS